MLHHYSIEIALQGTGAVNIHNGYGDALIIYIHILGIETADRCVARISIMFQNTLFRGFTSLGCFGRDIQDLACLCQNRRL
jgi:hypothetical protein